MKATLTVLLHFIVFMLLSITTQIGGIVYLLSKFLAYILKIKSILKSGALFFLLYSFSTFIIVPNIAPFFGREKVNHLQTIKPATWVTVFLNRNYVTPELNKVLQNTQKSLTKINSDIEIIYLDACFPFVNGFPLLPHLSHNDGKKIDLSFVYTEKGKVSKKTKSRSGYGIFEAPNENEENRIEYCEEKGAWQYNLARFLTFGKTNSDLQFATKETKLLIETILQNNSVGKIFIEPHLKQRLQLNYNKIRWQGCHSVRHDDHIHLQLK